MFKLYDRVIDFLIITFLCSILPISIILNIEQIDQDLYNILSQAFTIESGSTPALGYPALYPIVLSLFLKIFGPFHLYVVGITIGVAIYVHIYAILKKIENKFVAVFTVLALNSYFFYSFGLKFYSTIPFQLTIYLFFIWLIVIKFFFENKLQRFKFVIILGLLFLLSLNSIQLLPLILMAISFGVFNSGLKIKRREVAAYTFIIFIAGFLSLVISLKKFEEEFNNFFYLVLRLFNAEVLKNNKINSLDLFLFKNTGNFDFDNNLKILLCILSVTIVILFFIKEKFNDSYLIFLIRLSTFFAFSTYTGFGEFTIISGRSQYFLVFSFTLTFSKVLNYLFTKYSKNIFNLKILILLFIFLQIGSTLIFPLKLK